MNEKNIKIIIIELKSKYSLKERSKTKRSTTSRTYFFKIHRYILKTYTC